MDIIEHFLVTEIDGRIVGCALLQSLGCAEDGVSVGELGAFVMAPDVR